jgi:hypothetical protein
MSDGSSLKHVARGEIVAVSVSERDPTGVDAALAIFGVDACPRRASGSPGVCWGTTPRLADQDLWSRRSRRSRAGAVMSCLSRLALGSCAAGELPAAHLTRPL